MFRSAWVWPAAGALLLVVIYVFDVGHGFVKDDFVWILTSRLESPGDLRGLLGAGMGFFRPIVSLSFAINHELFGVRPIGYGLTNLALLLACVAAMMGLLRALGLGRGVAVAIALLWALNFQGIGMAVLWISGRTALLVTLFSVAAAWAWTRERPLAAALLTMTAMWSKEEAFALPAILTAWSLLDSPRSRLRAVGRSWPLWVVAALSLAVRAASGAYTPASAPSYYRYQFDVVPFAENAVAYLDRVGTTAFLALLLFWMASGGPGFRRSISAGPSEGTRSRRLILKGVVWLVLALAPTILLPVRSSLYAVLPSVGIMLIVGHLAEWIERRVASGASRRAVVVVSLIFIGLVPVYRIRNARYVNEAELSASIVAEFQKIASEQPDGGLVVIKDARDVRPTAEQALGALADRAAFITTDGRIRAWIDPPPADLSGPPPPDLESAVARLVVERGSVRRER